MFWASPGLEVLAGKYRQRLNDYDGSPHCGEAGHPVLSAIALAGSKASANLRKEPATMSKKSGKKAKAVPEAVKDPPESEEELAARKHNEAYDMVHRAMIRSQV